MNPGPAHYRPFLLALMLFIGGLALAQDDATELPELRDQFGNPVGLETGADEAQQLAIVVTARRLRRIKAWEEALREAFPELAIIRIADIPRRSPTSYDKVAEKLRQRLPPDIAVGIDLEGSWATALDLDTSVPTILLFDTGGKILFRHAGMYRQSGFPPLKAQLAELLQTLPAGAVAATR